ncbi:hypothetical protein ACFWP3_09510 [Streptomyces sp. NPDC058525]|uniref:hypothetical protein n=1 Tax=Streptomyces sp. NPDC058525 TaxID=3346538 RepID=UPI00364C0FEB
MNRRAASTTLATSLAGVLALTALTGCGGDPDAASGAGDDKAPLTVWVRKPPGSPTEQTHRELAAAFTRSTGIQAEVTALFDDFETKLQQAAAQRKLPA